MHRAFLALLLLLPLAVAARADNAPQSPVDGLLAQLKSAATPEQARPLEAQILAAFLASGSPSVDLLMGRAEAALAAGNRDVARHLLDEITAIAPRYAEGWHRRALLQQQAGEDGAAMASLQRAIELNPRQFEAMAQFGAMLEDYGDKPGALRMYRRALALDPQYEGLQRRIDGLTRAVEGQGI